MNEQDALGDSELDSRSIASLAWLFITTLRLKGQEYDRLRGYDVIRKRVSSLNSLAGFTEDPLELVSTESWFEPLKGIAHETGVEVCELHDAPDPARLPMVTWVAGKGWGIIRSISPQNTWIVDFNGRVEQIPATNALPAVRLDMRQTPEAISKKPVFAIFHKLFLSSKKEFIEAGLSSIVINLLAVMVSLYSMQVYDRVIPTQGYSTLSVLTIGVFITLIFDLAIKVVRGIFSSMCKSAWIRIYPGNYSLGCSRFVWISYLLAWDHFLPKSVDMKPSAPLFQAVHSIYW